MGQMLRVSVADFHSARYWRSEALEERDGRRFVAGWLRTSGRGRNEAAGIDHGGATLAISPRSRRGEAVRAYPHHSVVRHASVNYRLAHIGHQYVWGYLAALCVTTARAFSFDRIRMAPESRPLTENITRTYNARLLPKTASLERSLMPEIVADSPAPSCSLLLSGVGIQESQPLAPDLFPPRAREAHGRFAEGNSGNPRGQPRGIRNFRRRVPDLVARPLSAQALSQLLDRKPRVLRPLLAASGCPRMRPSTLEFPPALSRDGSSRPSCTPLRP